MVLESELYLFVFNPLVPEITTKWPLREFNSRNMCDHNAWVIVV